MVRRAFFSFHYRNDIWRVNQVRNNWRTRGRETAGYIDSAKFEKIKRQGKKAVENWIDSQLKNTSVTVVLIGNQTSTRKYVRYEIRESLKRGNGIIGVHINNLKDNEGKTSVKGDPFFGKIGEDKLGNPIYFHHIAKVYDYKSDNGYNNMGKWIEEAANSVGK